MSIMSERFGPISRAPSNMSARLASEASARFGNMSRLPAADLSYLHLASPTRAGSTISASDRFGPGSAISSLEVAPAYDLSDVKMTWPQGMSSAEAAAPVALSQSVGLEEFDVETPPWGRSLSALG